MLWLRDLRRWLQAFPSRRARHRYSRRRLSLVIAAVHERLGTARVRNMPDPTLLPLLEVSGALVRGCLEAAQSVLVLADNREFGGITSCERAAWEMWNELDYLLNTDNPPLWAVKIQVNALLQVIDLLGKVAYAPAGMLARNEEALARLERDNPGVVDEVKKQRKNDPRHWSGRSRTAIVAPGEAEKTVYKLLSWETHPDVVSLRDVEAEIVEGDGVLRLTAPDDIDAIVERSANSASEILLRAWNVFATFWQLDHVRDIPPRKSA